MNKFNKFVRQHWAPILILGIILIITANSPSVYAAASDAFKNHPGVTTENMNQAQKIGGPIYTIFGNLAGLIAIIVVVWQGVQTAIDLMYYYMPFTRSLLNPGANQQAPQQGSGMGGGMGMSGGMGMGGGMGGGGASAPQPAQRSFLIVSDDMLKAMELNGSNQTQQGAGAGQGMGGMGGMGGGMGMNPSAGAAPANKSSVVTKYFTLRVVSMIMLGLCITVLLTSSILLDSGINIGSLIVKGLSFVNGNAEKYTGTNTIIGIKMLFNL